MTTTPQHGAPQFPLADGNRAPSSHESMDASIEVLVAQKQAWIQVPLATRIAIIDALITDFVAIAPRWVAASVQAKGVEENSPLTSVDDFAREFAQISATLPATTTRSVSTGAFQEETPAPGYALRNWQFLPPIIAPEKIADVQPPFQQPDSQFLPVPGYLLDTSPVVMVTPSLSEEPVAAAFSSPSKPDGSEKYVRNQESLYDSWGFSPQESALPKRLPVVRRTTNPKEFHQLSTNPSLPLERAKAHFHELASQPVSRRKIIAMHQSLHHQIHPLNLPTHKQSRGQCLLSGQLLAASSCFLLLYRQGQQRQYEIKVRPNRIAVDSNGYSCVCSSR